MFSRLFTTNRKYKAYDYAHPAFQWIEKRLNQTLKNTIELCSWSSTSYIALFFLPFPFVYIYFYSPFISHQTEHRVWNLFMLHSSTKYQNTQKLSMPIHSYKKVSCSILFYSIQFYPRIFLIDCSLFRSGSEQRRMSI